MLAGVEPHQSPLHKPFGGHDTEALDPASAAPHAYPVADPAVDVTDILHVDKNGRSAECDGLDRGDRTVVTVYRPGRSGVGEQSPDGRRTSRCTGSGAISIALSTAAARWSTRCSASIATWMAAKAFFQSAKTVADVTPDRVTTDGHDSYPRAIRTKLGEGVKHRTSRYLAASKVATSRCVGSSVHDRRAGSVEAMMNCATSSVPAVGSEHISAGPAGSNSSAALRP